MSFIIGTDFSDSFVCSGTEEEEALLAAHLGLYDSHVTAFEEHMDSLAYEDFCQQYTDRRWEAMIRSGLDEEC